MSSHDTAMHREAGGHPLASILEERATELTERWHRELEQRLRIRPRNVFPGSDLLDGIPALIRWIAATLRNGRELSPEQRETAHDLARYWRDAGYSIEESLLHTGILGTILHEALRAALEDDAVDLSPVEAATLSERLCQSMNRIDTVLVGTYRDEEERRFADFGGTLAHEIRGRLNVAMTAAETLRAAGTDPSDEAAAIRDEAIDRVTEAIDAAADMIKAVRRFSRVRSGFAEWTMTPFDALVEEVVDRLRDESEEDVRVNVADPVPADPVPAEAVKLALHNLVENAIKYADPEKDERWVRIHVRTETDRSRWLVQIGDNGIGIPEYEQERIFTRFLRGSRSSGNGFGLGLSIARQAALSIGGTVMLESQEGEGSTFSFTVPFPENVDD